ncbi:hypothetical protein DPMN_022309 [Dreissena polymorpha]|uniref:Uncharacterized protein n=1 Tax=Dreissena polymorpha TaxID=45954 RepID=A0A9D4SBM3_DREPO|nr:hypothetical protein DPMN_022309 [Dreissena polymorpha]
MMVASSRPVPSGAQLSDCAVFVACSVTSHPCCIIRVTVIRAVEVTGRLDLCCPGRAG